MPTRKLAEAMAFLETALADGPLPASRLLMEAQRAGIRRRTLIRAKYALGVVAIHKGWTEDGYWIWLLPAPVFETMKEATFGMEILVV